MSDRNFIGEYPDDWHEIAKRIKTDVGWRCIRCGHGHNPKQGYCLTVHHFDNNKSNIAWWNLGALCQKCHLQIQGKVIMERTWMFEHSEWFKPYVAGYYAHQFGLDERREVVTQQIDYLIALGQGKVELA